MPRIDRRHLVTSTLALGVVSPYSAIAQAYPSRPVTLVSGFSPGSPQDLVLRAIADTRVDPSDDANSAIITACSRGFLDIVLMLLDDPRVDPTVGNNKCIKDAELYGRKEISRALFNAIHQRLMQRHIQIENACAKNPKQL